MSAFKIPTLKNIVIFIGLVCILIFSGVPSITQARVVDPEHTGDPGNPTPTSVDEDGGDDILVDGIDDDLLSGGGGDDTLTGGGGGGIIESWTQSAKNGLLNLLNSFVVTVFGWLVGITGFFFDYAVSHFVIGFGHNYRTTGVGMAIDSLWGTVRDIFNLTFIFGLVYIGFQMILGSNTSAQRSLGYLIAAALLVNFSLFITKFVVDFANLAASQIYNAFGNSGGLAFTFANLMGLSSIFNASNPGEITFGDGWGGLAYIFGTMIIFMVLAFVFTAGAVMLSIRYVVLNIYLVASPIMFLGWVFPQMAGQSQKYWKGFLGQAFFAPAYIFMLYMSYRVLSGYNGRQTGDSSLFALFKSGTNGGGANEVTSGAVIAYVALTIIFLLASLVVAKNMGATGADRAISIGQKMRKGVQGAVTSYAGRNTIGRGSEWLGKQNDKLEGSRTGRNLKRVLSTASLGTLTERTRRNITEAGKKAKFGGSYSRNDDTKFSSEVTATRALGKLNDSISTGVNALPGSAEQIAFEQAITNATPSQLITQLRKHKPGSAPYNKIIQAMSHNQVSKILDSKDDEFDATERGQLATARGGQVEDRLVANNPSLGVGISKANTDDLVALGYQRLLANAEHISATRMDDLKSKLTPTEYSNLDKERTVKMEALLGTTAATALYVGKKDSDIARLPKSVLTDPRMFLGLNQRVLEIILRENYLNTTERNTIKTNIRTMGGAGHPLTIWLSTPVGLAF